MKKIVRWLASGLLLALCATVGAQTTDSAYPAKPVRIYVPQNPGGTTDVLARYLADRLTKMWGQPVIVDYKPGAGGNIGADFVAKSPADGYTMMMGYVGTQAVNGAIYKNLPYDPDKDFIAVASVAIVPFMYVVNKDLGVATMAELIALARTRQLNYATSGNGSLNHLMGEILNRSAGINILHIPYKGIAQAVTDTIGGQVQVLPIAVPSVIQYLRAGSVKPLAVTSTKRVGSLPDVPTMAEAGVDALSFDSWFGLFAPASTPAQVVQKINQSVNEILNTPDAATTFASVGAETLSMSTQAFGELVRKDTARWGKVARESGATVE